MKRARASVDEKSHEAKETDTGAGLTHVDAKGRVTMVDVGEKPVTEREAVARACVRMKPETLSAIIRGTLKKGEVLATAKLAGIMAAKRTHELIPLCHQLPLDVIEVSFRTDEREGTLEIQSKVKTNARTGVEMEALVASSVAALTVYDMAKAVDREMVIDNVRLVKKRGGRSGEFVRSNEPAWDDDD